MSTFPPGGPDLPEILPPHPHREPERPAPAPPVVSVPITYDAPDVHGQLFDRRRLLLSGPLDHDAATRLCAELMTLDGRSDDEVELVIRSDGGPLDAVAAVLDVIGAMRAPVATSCIGAARGTAAVLLASGTGERRAAPHATISLRCDATVALEGTAADVGRQAEQVARLRERLVEALVGATGQPAERMAHEVDAGGFHDAAAARELGIIDRILDDRRPT